MNWNDEQLDEIIKNSPKTPNFGILEGIFALLEDGALKDNTNPNLKVHLPKETSDDLLKKYQKYFGSLENIAGNINNYGGLNLKDDQWLRDIELPAPPTPEQDINLAPILGGAFGGIAVIGLIASGIVFYKKRKQK